MGGNISEKSASKSVREVQLYVHLIISKGKNYNSKTFITIMLSRRIGEVK